MEMDALEKSRTVVVSGVPKGLPVSRMIDKLTIHFQSYRRSHGGDVEVVQYPTNMDGVAFVTFDKSADADRAVRKEEQIMMDDEFPTDYLLTVFPFTADVFLHVSRAVVDLSAFGSNQASLIQSLRSAHRSLHFLPLLKQRKATVEGPFSAVQALRDDLIRRADRLKSIDSSQTAAVKIPHTPPNPEVVSYHGSKAKPEPAESLSTGLQSTGEVKSLLSNAKTPNDSSRRKVQERGSAEGSFRDKDVDGEEQNSQTGVEMPARSRSQKVFKQRPEELSAKEEKIFEKHTLAKRTPKENHLDKNAGYEKESDRSSLTTAAGFKDDLNSSRRNTEEQRKETCVWVDSNTLEYIKRFDKKKLDKCLRGVAASVKRIEGSDLVSVTLSEERTSKVTTVIQQALEELQTLVESWVTTLRVHEIDLEEEEEEEEQQRRKQEVVQICDDVNDLYDDVLYMFEGSRIKVIGPSLSSYLFSRLAKSRISNFKTNT